MDERNGSKDVCLLKLKKKPHRCYWSCLMRLSRYAVSKFFIYFSINPAIYPPPVAHEECFIELLLSANASKQITQTGHQVIQGGDLHSHTSDCKGKYSQQVTALRTPPFSLLQQLNKTLAYLTFTSRSLWILNIKRCSHYQHNIKPLAQRGKALSVAN